MNKAERTRRHIIEKTAPLFNMNGFDGTSLSDLCKATGLTKGALYGHFADKEELSREAFLYTIGRIRSKGARSMMRKTTYKQRLFALLDFFVISVLHTPVKGGCPLLNTSVEVDDRRTSMRKTVLKELQKSVASMTKILEAGKRAGEFRNDIDSHSIATWLFCSIEGAIMLSRVSQSADAMTTVTSQIRSMVEAFSVNKSNKKYGSKTRSSNRTGRHNAAGK